MTNCFVCKTYRHDRALILMILLRAGGSFDALYRTLCHDHRGDVETAVKLFQAGKGIGQS